MPFVFIVDVYDFIKNMNFPSPLFAMLDSYSYLCSGSISEYVSMLNIYERDNKRWQTHKVVLSFLSFLSKKIHIFFEIRSMHGFDCIFLWIFASKCRRQLFHCIPICPFFLTLKCIRPLWISCKMAYPPPILSHWLKCHLLWKKNHICS